jgi:hypothetical protein
MKMRILVNVLVLSFLAFHVGCKTCSIKSTGRDHNNWILPAADDNDILPSPPSVQGYITSVKGELITLKCELKDSKEKESTIIRLTSDTQIFTNFGGYCKRDDLSKDQYAWIWYITKNSKKAGTPPRSAVVMLWSKNPNDKPSDKVKRQFSVMK